MDTRHAAYLNIILVNNHIIDRLNKPAMELSENVSQKHIALDNNISTQTMRAAKAIRLQQNKFLLPAPNIAFDDFRQVSSQLAEWAWF